MQLSVLFVVCIFATLIAAQEGPAPPRLTIPGAIPLPIRPQYRNEKLGPIRIRRPILRPQQINALPVPVTPRIIEESKPVTEENEEEEAQEVFIPQILSQQQQQQQQSPQIFQEQNTIQQEAHLEEPPQINIPRFQPQERPAPQRLPEFQSAGGQRFSVNPDRPKRPRPAHRDSRPQYDSEPVQIVRQSINRPSVSRPPPSPIQHEIVNDVRSRKPVPQIVRKYQEENEDGSITWGYENDDGSFKEETIGIDCVTRGRYGYIDPDGLKREYNYETGILCDPNKRNDPEEEERSGYVDYEGNRAVLPNGVEIDLASMGKKKSKRPGAVLPPQQFYRN